MSELMGSEAPAGPTGLCGPHRTGKTTLARAFAEKYKIPFVQTSASNVFELLGKDPKINYPIEERIVIQEAILFAFEAQYAAARKLSTAWISDRTPIDLASYMIADVQRETFTGQYGLSVLVNDYIDRCIKSTNQWFSTVVLVQPGIVMVEAPGKAPACPAYVEHLNLIQSGLLLREELVAQHYMIPRQYTNLEERIKSVKNATLHSEQAVACVKKVFQASGGFYH